METRDWLVIAGYFGLLLGVAWWVNGLMPLRPIDGKIAIRTLIDRPMIEIFANHGEQIATLPYENDLNIESVKAFCEGGDARLLSLDVYQLNAKWDN